MARKIDGEYWREDALMCPYCDQSVHQLAIDGSLGRDFWEYEKINCYHEGCGKEFQYMQEIVLSTKK